VGATFPLLAIGCLAGRDGAISNVYLHVFGKDHTIQAPLVNLSVRLRGDACGCDVTREIPLVCAVTELDTTDYDVILPADVVRELQVNDASVSTLSCDTEDVRSTAEGEPTDNAADAENVVSVDKTHHDDSEGDVSALVSEQAADPTLRPCWAQAAVGKGDSPFTAVCYTIRTKKKGSP